jgi:alpha-glucosidase
MPWTAEGANAGFTKAKPWLPVDPTHRRLAVDVQESDPDSIVQFARRAISLRRKLTSLRTGALRFIDAPESMLVFTRGEGSDAVLCAFNLDARAADWTPPQGWEVIEAVNAQKRAANAFPGLAGLVARRR